MKNINVLHQTLFIIDEVYFQKLLVSMPFLGLLSFLPVFGQKLKDVELRVNALPRASFISTNGQKKMQTSINLCQCPSSGFFHFYGVFI